MGDLDRLRQALAFYADEANWSGTALFTVEVGDRLGPAVDFGHHARTVLAELEADPDPSSATALWLGG